MEDWNRVPVPALPCPYCLEVHNTDPELALWLGENGGDPETADSELEMHMAGCDRKGDPIAKGFVEASELVGRTNAEFGLSAPRREQKSGMLVPNGGGG